MEWTHVTVKIKGTVLFDWLVFEEGELQIWYKSPHLEHPSGSVQTLPS